MERADPSGVGGAVQRLDAFEFEGTKIWVEPSNGRSGGGPGSKSGLRGSGRAGSRPKGSRRGARGRKRGL